MSDSLTEINNYIYQQIPLSQALGVTIKSYDGQQIVLSAPLAPNFNHRQTAFGGSLSAIAILAGWSLLFIKMRELALPVRLVIQHSEFNFTAPVDSDFLAHCLLPEDQHWQRFINTLKRRNKARIRLQTKIKYHGGIGGHSLGDYVAIQLDKTSS